MDKPKDVEFIYSGHAGCILRIEGKNIGFDLTGLSDPYCNSWFYYPEQAKNSVELDAIIVSHEHADHYDPLYLKSLDKKTKIIIVGKRQSFVDQLERDNIDYTVLDANQECQIFDGVYVYGFVDTRNNVDGSCLLYNKNRSVSLYHGNDHWIDLKLLNETVQILGIDTVKYSMFPFCYVGWFPFCLDVPLEEKQRLAKREYLKHLEKGVDFVNTIQSSYYIPNGANLVHCSNVDSLINTSMANPQDFYDYFFDKNPNSDKRVLPLSSGDFIHLERVSMKKDVYNKENISAEIEAFREKANKTKSEQIQKSDLFDALINIQNRINKSHSHFKTTQLVFIKPHNSDKIYKIDRVLRKVAVVDKKEVDAAEAAQRKYHLISFNDAVANYFYFKDQRKLESLIGARRVNIKRYPDNKDYCVDTFYWMSNL